MMAGVMAAGPDGDPNDRHPNPVALFGVHNHRNPPRTVAFPGDIHPFKKSGSLQKLRPRRVLVKSDYF
jgi:hypothetical protein